MSTTPADGGQSPTTIKPHNLCALNSGRDVGGGSRISSRKALSPQKKLESINQQIAELRQKRFEEMRLGGPKKPLSPPKPKKRKKQSVNANFHHPKLEYVYGEVIYSPYMVSPNKTYPKEYFEVPKKLRELKRDGLRLKKVEKEKRPYNLDETRKRFIDEVINYHVCFTDAVSEVLQFN